MEIYVDVFKQKELLSQYNLFDHELGIPTFPLNTDGIDPSGTNVTIKDVKITCFDDAVAVKPCNGGCKYSTCSEDIYVSNAVVVFGVGMTIGTVSPHDKHNCIRNVHFKNVTMHYPLKAIYVKNNPGTSGTGIIENILYEDFKINFPVWWGVYIGPQ